MLTVAVAGVFYRAAVMGLEALHLPFSAALSIPYYLIACVFSHVVYFKLGGVGALLAAGIAFATSIIVSYSVILPLVVSAEAATDSPHGFDAMVSIGIAYVVNIGYVLGLSLGILLVGRLTRFDRIPRFQAHLLDIFMRIDGQGLVLASPRGRQHLILALSKAAEAARFGLLSGRENFQRSPLEVRQHFVESAEYIQSLTIWVVAPQQETQTHLRDEIAYIFAAAFSGRLHFLPRARVPAVSQGLRLPLILGAAKSISSAAVPAIILTIADHFGLLPEGLRQWLIAVSLLGLAVGIALTISPSGLRSLDAAVKMLPSASVGSGKE